MPYVLPELRYDYGALEPHYRAESLELHHRGHHAAYVRGANQALEQLAEARSTSDASAITGLEKSLAFNVSGHVLHSIFWTVLSPHGGGRPDGELLAAIEDSFGSFDAFRTQLTRASISVQGSGWGALVYEPVGRRLLVEQVYDHQGNLVHGATPLLVLDVWEHAYYLQYRNARASYVDALWNVIDWSHVASRLAVAEGTAVELASHAAL